MDQGPAAPGPGVSWPGRLRAAAGPVVIAACFIVFAAASWRKWPDVLIDFGRELYVPWQLASGKLLYRDIAYFNGPLSPYLNSLGFKVFGTSFTTLIFMNLAIAAGIAALIYRFFADTLDRVAAFAAALVFVTVFAFAEYYLTGSQNFIAPYSHEATHGTALSLAMIYALYRYFGSRNRRWLILAGLGLGLIALTKGEIFAAALAAAGAAFLALAAHDGIGATLKKSPSFIVPALVPPLAAFLAFLGPLGPAGALHGVAAFWYVLFTTSASQNNFYHYIFFGPDTAAAGILHLALYTVEVLIVAAAAALADYAAGKFKHPHLIGVCLFTAIMAVLILLPSLVPWPELPRSFPLLLAGVIALLAAAVFRHRHDRDFPRLAALLTWAVFSLALLAKMLLHVQFYDYGFLAMPAAVFIAAMLTGQAPHLLRNTAGKGILFRWVALAIIAVNIVYYARWSESYYEKKTLAVGHGGDVIMTYDNDVSLVGTDMLAALNYIDLNLPADATFAAAPEGAMLNYLARRPSSCPYVVFMPVEVAAFGEDNMLAALVRSPPDYFLLVERDTAGYERGPFGQDPRYGMKIMQWVSTNYRPIALIGAEPFQSGGFGIKIMERKP